MKCLARCTRQEKVRLFNGELPGQIPLTLPLGVFIPLLPPATKLGRGNIFSSLCQEFCTQGGELGGLPHCMLGYTP